MRLFKLPLLILNLTVGLVSNAVEYSREEYVVDYMSRGTAIAADLKSGSRQAREHAYNKLKEAYAFFNGRQNHTNGIYMQNDAPLKAGARRSFKEQLTTILLNRYSIAELQSEEVITDNPNDTDFLALMKLGILAYYVLYLPESPSRALAMTAFLGAFQKDGTKSYEVPHRRNEASPIYGNVSIFNADEPVIDAISKILRDSISNQQSGRMNEVLSLFEEQGQPSSLLKRIVNSNGPFIFSEEQVGLRYLFQVIRAQRPELMIAALNFDYKTHMSCSWSGPCNGSDMVRFFLQRNDQNLVQLLNRSGMTNYHLTNENVFSVHSDEMDLVKYLHSNTRLRDAFVARALLSVYSKDDYGSTAKKFLADIAKNESGRQIIAAVARRCMRLDPALVRIPEMAFLTEHDYAKEEWVKKNARLAYAGLNALASLALLTLEDVNFLVKDQIRGFSWATVLYKNHAYSVREAVQAVLKAQGYGDKDGWGAYLHERHGFVYSEDPELSDHLSNGGRRFPLWEYYGIAFDPHGIAPNSIAGNRRFTRIDDYRETEQSRLEMLAGFPKGPVPGPKDCETLLTPNSARK